MAGTLRAPARFAVVPQTERSRLDFPVSALDVALMGSISTLPWWRRPGRAQRRAARAALAAVGLDEQADATFGDLSGGQRQRVLVARALVQDARVILLDEPFTGLDAPSAERLEALLGDLAGEGRGVMIATHDVDQARGWDSVLCLNRRQVAFGPPSRHAAPRRARGHLRRRDRRAAGRRAARRRATPPSPLMLAVAAHAHRSVGRPGRAARAARGRAAGRDRRRAGVLDRLLQPLLQRRVAGPRPAAGARPRRPHGHPAAARRRSRPARGRDRDRRRGQVPAIGRDTAVAVVGDHAVRRRRAAGALARPRRRGSRACSSATSSAFRTPTSASPPGWPCSSSRALALLHARLLAVGFDRLSAPGVGVRPLVVDLALLTLVALALLVAVQGLGNLLVVAVFVAPACGGAARRAADGRR